MVMVTNGEVELFSEYCSDFSQGTLQKLKQKVK